MKYARIIFVSLLILNTSLVIGQCGAFNGSLTPPRPNVCVGAGVLVTFNCSFSLFGSITWNYTGTSAPVHPIPPLQCNVPSITSGGSVVATGSVTIGGVHCPFTVSIPVSTVAPTAQAGLDMPITQVTNNVIGGSPSATLGASPYTYTWSPNTGFVSPSTINDPNPVVNPSGPTAYTLTITGADGCTATDVMQFYASASSYGELQRSLDAGYYQVNNGKLYFKLNREYSSATQLKYRILDQSHAVRVDYSASGPSLSVSPGDNRFLLNLAVTPISFLSTDINNFFTLEVTDEKNQVFLLKFRYAN